MSELDKTGLEAVNQLEDRLLQKLLRAVPGGRNPHKYSAQLTFAEANSAGQRIVRLNEVAYEQLVQLEELSRFKASATTALEAELEVIANEARRYASFYPTGFAAHNSFVDFAKWIEHRSVSASLSGTNDEPLLKTIERILDEESAYISRPSREVTRRIALAAGIAGMRANKAAEAEYPKLLEEELKLANGRVAALERALSSQQDATSAGVTEEQVEATAKIIAFAGRTENDLSRDADHFWANTGEDSRLVYRRMARALEASRSPVSQKEAEEHAPRPMTGFWSILSDEQKKKALAYRGSENHGEPVGRPAFEELHPFWQGYIEELSQAPAGEPAIKALEPILTKYLEHADNQQGMRRASGVAQLFHEMADEIRSALQTSPTPVSAPVGVADKIIGEIEQRFPNWRGYRDLIDCIDCTLHDLRSGLRSPAVEGK